MASDAQATNNYVHHMLSTHTLAEEIIAHHGTDKAILDDQNLALLRDYCAKPSNKEEVLREHGMFEDPTLLRGAHVSSGRSLAEFVVEKDALSKEEIAMLKAWFDRGM